MLILLRHGQTAVNAEGRLLGRADPPLTDLGRRQAQALADAVGRDGRGSNHFMKRFILQAPSLRCVFMV